VLLAALPAVSGARCRRPADSAVFGARGPHRVGVRTLTFVDTSRSTPPHGRFPGAPTRTLVTEVWYPAATAGRDVPADPAGAPYPLVIHSHALLDSRLGERYLTEHLASHGYVVAAPDYPLSNAAAAGGPTVLDLASQPGDLRHVLGRLLASDGPMASAIDPTHVGASGLSFGAITTLLATYDARWREPAIRAALPIAPPYSCALTRRFFRTARVPLLVLHGTSDLLVPYRENGARVFRHARGPRHLVLIDDAAHLGFVGFATGLSSTAHYDGLGCAALLSTLGDDVSLLPIPGGRAEGITRAPRACPAPCQDTAVPPGLAATRQHALTALVATAFFDAYLKDDVAARCYLRRGLARDYPELATRARADEDGPGPTRP
jgi:predicted dienelactone hydrolase